MSNVLPGFHIFTGYDITVQMFAKGNLLQKRKDYVAMLMSLVASIDIHFTGTMGKCRELRACYINQFTLI